MHLVRYSFRYLTASGHIVSVGPGKHPELPPEALKAGEEQGALGNVAEVEAPTRAPQNQARESAPTTKPRRGRRRRKG
jgi:hypothetical protein